MNTRTSVISERKVWFQHALVWFIYVECDFYTQSGKKLLRHLQLRFQHAQEWLLHAECDDDTYECDDDNHEKDYDTYTCQTRTMRVEITLLCDVHTYTVMNTRTSVISERKLWFQHARVWFIYVECDFHTQSVISTRRV
jgi:hypothetical protein